MDSDLTRLTVFFEALLWVGVFERFEGGTLGLQDHLRRRTEGL